MKKCSSLYDISSCYIQIITTASAVLVLWEVKAVCTTEPASFSPKEEITGIENIE